MATEVGHISEPFDLAWLCVQRALQGILRAPEDLLRRSVLAKLEAEFRRVYPLVPGGSFQGFVDGRELVAAWPDGAKERVRWVYVALSLIESLGAQSNPVAPEPKKWKAPKLEVSHGRSH